jgi:hypothetical protein
VEDSLVALVDDAYMAPQAGRGAEGALTHTTQELLHSLQRQIHKEIREGESFRNLPVCTQTLHFNHTHFIYCITDFVSPQN